MHGYIYLTNLLKAADWHPKGIPCAGFCEPCLAALPISGDLLASFHLSAVSAQSPGQAGLLSLAVAAPGRIVDVDLSWES